MDVLEEGSKHARKYCIYFIWFGLKNGGEVNVELYHSTFLPFPNWNGWERENEVITLITILTSFFCYKN